MRLVRAFLPWLLLGFVLWGVVIALVLALEPSGADASFVYPI